MNEGWPVLLKLWAIPGVAAIAAVAGTCMIQHPWARRILVAFGLTVVIPVPLFSPDGGAVVPLGVFLMSPEAFPKSVFLVAIPVAVLAGAFWLFGLVIGSLKKRIKRSGQRETSPYSEPATRSPQE